MKKLFISLAAISMALASCQQNNGYTIKGTVDGVADGEIVYLQDFTHGELVKLDSAIVQNGKFQFKGTQEVAVPRFVTYIKDDKQLAVDFFLENGTISIDLSEEGKVSGTTNNNVYQEFKNKFAAAQKELNESFKKMQADTTLTAEQRKEIMSQLEEKEDESIELAYNTIKENITNAVGIQLFPSYAPAFSTEQQQALVDLIPEDLVNERIQRIKDHLALIAKTGVGKQFIDFTMKTPEGKEVKLSDYVNKNKYTLVDFWASWCGPCRQEMPNVVEAYKNFKAKGFGIVGVSLDSNEEAWKKAIAELGMTWPQMSDIKGWQCEGAKLYGVNAIPATVLIDQEGIIVERNLRGEALTKRLSELMNL